MMDMVKAVIFDLNGVFVKSPKLSDRFLDEFGVPVDEFLAALKEVMAKVRMPNAGNAYLAWKPYLKKWNVKMSEEEFFDFWFNAEREIPEMVRLARDLREKGVKVFILSNNLEERTEYYEKHFPSLGEVTDKTYFSWQTGFVKPDERAYRLVLEENNLKPEECVYFDDSERNVEVAGRIGIKSFLFETPETTRKTIEGVVQ